MVVNGGIWWYKVWYKCGTDGKIIDPLTENQRVCDRPFSHHWTLDRSLFVGFNRNDVSLLHPAERGCCGYTIAEVICAFGSLSAYVCYPRMELLHSSLEPFYRLTASALFCTDRVATTELGNSRANRTPISSFGDYRSTIELCSRIGRASRTRTYE